MSVEQQQQKCSCFWVMHIEGFHGEMPRWLHGTFRRFGKIGVQAYIHAHRYTYVCMHTDKERKREIEREIKLLGKVLRV